jgi:integrase
LAINKRTTKTGTRYTVQAVVPNPAGGRGTRHTIGTYRTRKQAENAERKAYDEIAAGSFNVPSPVPPAVVTVADTLDIWLQTKRNSVTDQTAHGYAAAIRLHLVPALGHVDVTTLTHDDVQRQVNAWRDAGMGARLLALNVTILRAALARQVKNGTLASNPADGIEKPSARTRKPFMIWTPEQAGAFLREASVDRRAPFWFLTLVEGMRRSEALGLRWGDLTWTPDETGAVATIHQTVIADPSDGGKAKIQPRAKTKGSQRTIALTAPTIAALKAHRDRQVFERCKMGEFWPDTDLIVTTALGTPINPSSIKRELKALITRSGAPPVTPHGLRHNAATIMLRAGVSPALVALKLGHSDIGTTVDRYGHLTVTDQSLVNAAMEAFLDLGKKSG